MFSDDLTEELDRLRREHLFRRIEDRGPARSMQRPSRISLGGREYINFASNDYLGLSLHPALGDAAKQAVDTYGFGAGASRLLAGGTEAHAELERAIARFKGAERALLFNSGYTANLSAIPALAREGDVLFSDELNHASIIDGCRLSRARVVVYRHRDMDHLDALLKREKGRRSIIITDSVFSMDGDIAPLPELCSLCRTHGALLYIDDAHGTGVLGTGRGALAHFGIPAAPWIVQMGTFSKAFGSFGAFIAAGSDCIEWLINTARGFIFSTALPAAAAAASHAALSLVEERADLVAALWRNREALVRGVQEQGFDILQSETPIVPVVVGDLAMTVQCAEALRKRGVYAPAIRPPTVRVARLRVTVTAAHEPADIDALLESLGRFR
ncbi:MAG: 8-amino-7-oxononanoate synthase [Nitrospirota bacterium]